MSTVRLDIQAAIDSGDPDELRAVINDAVRALRNRLWRTAVAERMQIHNSDYGFARNFAGLRWVWGLAALGSFLGCWVAYIWYDRPILWGAVSTIIAVCAFALLLLLPGYVRKRADYYAESFFAAAVALSEGGADNQQRTEVSPNPA